MNNTYSAVLIDKEKSRHCERSEAIHVFLKLRGLNTWIAASGLTSLLAITVSPLFADQSSKMLNTDDYD